MLVGPYRRSNVTDAAGRLSSPLGPPDPQCVKSATNCFMEQTHAGDPPWVIASGCGHGAAAYAYDTHSRTFGRVVATGGVGVSSCGNALAALPVNCYASQATAVGSRLLLLGGECDTRAINGTRYWHTPKLALSGEMKEISAVQRDINVL